MKSSQILAAALAVGIAAVASAQDAAAPAAPKALESAGALFGVRESVESIDLSPSGTRIVYVTPGKGAVGAISDRQLTEIAQTKLPDLNTDDLEAAKLQIAGTARSMGIRVTG